jgi:hypothetical protein
MVLSSVSYLCPGGKEKEGKRGEGRKEKEMKPSFSAVLI